MEINSEIKKIAAHQISHEELPAEHDDVFIKFLHTIIHFAVRILALLMTQE